MARLRQNGKNVEVLDDNDGVMMVIPPLGYSPYAAGGVAAAQSNRMSLGGNRVWFGGDSLMVRGGLTLDTTQGNIAMAFDEAQPAPWAAMLSGQRAWVEGVAATTGYTTDDWLTKIPAGLTKTWLQTVLDARPAACVICLGTNDVSNGVAQAVTISNYIKIFQTLALAGIIPVICSLPPRPSLHLQNTKLNIWLKSYALANGWPFVDNYAAMVAFATGNMNATYDAGDGIHQNAAGAKVMGQAFSDAISTLLPSWTPPLPASAEDPTGIFAVVNPLFTLDGNSDGVPDGWTLNGGGAPSLSITTDAGVLGNMWSITRGSADLDGLIGAPATPAGHTCEVALRVKTTLQATGSGVHVRVEGQTQGAYMVGLLGSGLSNQTLWTRDIAWSTLYARFVNRAADPSPRFRFQLKGAAGGNISFGQLIVRDLTALGLA